MENSDKGNNCPPVYWLTTMLLLLFSHLLPFAMIADYHKLFSSLTLGLLFAHGQAVEPVTDRAYRV